MLFKEGDELNPSEEESSYRFLRFNFVKYIQPYLPKESVIIVDCIITETSGVLFNSDFEIPVLSKNLTFSNENKRFIITEALLLLKDDF